MDNEQLIINICKLLEINIFEEDIKKIISNKLEDNLKDNNYLIYLICYYIDNEDLLFENKINLKSLPEINLNKIIDKLYNKNIIFICFILINLYKLSNFDYIIDEYLYIKNLEKKINKEIKWDLVINKENYSYKNLKTKNGNIINKINLNMNSKPLTLVSLINEVKLYNNFLPFCKFSDSNNLSNILEKEVFLFFKLPFFFNNRIIQLYGKAYDFIYEKKFIIFIIKDNNKNFDNLKEIYDKLKIKNNPTQVNINLFFVRIDIIKENLFDVNMFFDININTNFVPDLLINLAIKQWNNFMIKKLKNLIQKIEKNDNNDWKKKLIENKDFYEFYEKKMKDIIN